MSEFLTPALSGTKRAVNFDPSTLSGGGTPMTKRVSSSQNQSSNASLEADQSSEIPALSEDRIKVLLMGSLPCYDQVFAAAYSDGMRKVSGSNKQNDTMDEITPLELKPLLCAGGKLRSLALHMISYLGVALQTQDVHYVQKAKDALGLALRCGILPEVFNSAAYAARQIELEVGQKHSEAALGSDQTTMKFSAAFDQALSDVEAAAVLLESLASNTIYSETGNLPMPTNTQLVTLAAAATSIARVISKLLTTHMDTFIGESLLETDEQLRRYMQIFVRLIQTHLYFGRHERSSQDLVVVSYYSEFKEPSFLLGCCKILLQFPRTAPSQIIANMLRQGTNFRSFNDALMDKSINGFSSILDALSSTSHDSITITNLLMSLSNAMASGAEFSKFLALNHALEYLQPAVLNDNAALAINACCCVGIIACQKDLVQIVDRSDTLKLVQDVLRAITPGSVILPNMSSLYQSDIQMYKQLIAGDSLPACQLIGLHDVSLYLPLQKNCDLLSMPEFVSVVRVCAQSSDAFVYSAACYVLRRLKLPIPNYREISNKAELDLTNPANWNIDQVCKWVGEQFFKCYRQRFRDGFVTGSALLALTDQDLTEMGVTSGLHRKSILLAIAGIDTGTMRTNSGDSISMSRGLSSKASSGVDVFISYRRQGGSDFAQLLKVCLKARGLDVFLDVENLGSGAFDDKLWSSLSNAKNVVIVWTKGCMDRFLGDADPANEDFVRKEYALALRLKKNIVPVKHESFDFPEQEKVPTDVRPIMMMNAVPWIGAYRDASFDKLISALIL